MTSTIRGYPAAGSAICDLSLPQRCASIVRSFHLKPTSFSKKHWWCICHCQPSWPSQILWAGHPYHGVVFRTRRSDKEVLFVCNQIFSAASFIWFGQLGPSIEHCHCRLASVEDSLLLWDSKDTERQSLAPLSEVKVVKECARKLLKKKSRPSRRLSKTILFHFRLSSSGAEPQWLQPRMKLLRRHVSWARNTQHDPGACGLHCPPSLNSDAFYSQFYFLGPSEILPSNVSISLLLCGILSIRKGTADHSLPQSLNSTHTPRRLRRHPKRSTDASSRDYVRSSRLLCHPRSRAECNNRGDQEGVQEGSVEMAP